MGRRRYLSTDISCDGDVNKLSDKAALLYTWALPHFADNCRLTPKNAAELRLAVIPGREWPVDTVDNCMEEIFSVGLWGRDPSDGTIYIPSKTFYKFQTYINAAKRRETPPIAANRRETPKNTTSPSPSPSPSLKEDRKKNKRPTPAASSFVLPDWIKNEIWEAFEEMRLKEKHPLTDRARDLIVKELQRIMAFGHDPNSCLERSTRNGWRDVYPLQNDQGSRIDLEAESRREKMFAIANRGL